MIASLLLLVACAVNLISAGLLVRQSRRLRDESERTQCSIEAVLRVAARVLVRCSPYLDCDQCGVRFDLQSGVSMTLDEAGELSLRCADCGPV